MIWNFLLLYFFTTLLCREFSIAENHTLFGVQLFSLKLGWCKENYILQVCVSLLRASETGAMSLAASTQQCFIIWRWFMVGQKHHLGENSISCCSTNLGD